MSAKSNYGKQRLSRLNEHRIEEWNVREYSETGTFGIGFHRIIGSRRVLVSVDIQGNEYIDPEEAESKGKFSEHPIFMGKRESITEYAHSILEQYDLPRPRRPGYFWEDPNDGRLCWGGNINEFDRDTFTGLWEPMASKFLNETLTSSPDCWEAIYASEYLDLVGEIEFERSRQRKTLAAFYVGLNLGEAIGAILAEWRLGLLHNPRLVMEHRRAQRAGDSLKSMSFDRNITAVQWNDLAVQCAKERYPKLSASAAGKFIKAHLKLGLKPETIAAVLRRRAPEWRQSSTKCSPKKKSGSPSS